MTVCPAPFAPAPLVILAPMAGITDLPFRRIVARLGASLVVSEMVASSDMLNATPTARARAELGLEEEHTVVQLAGRDPAAMAEAARRLAGDGARAIDINMGCPARRVTAPGGAGACGAALMRDPDQALRVISAVAGAVALPVTVKMRLGWDAQTLNAPDLARRAVAAGVSRVTVHGRTRAQFYEGRADWAAIGATVRAVPVPVMANGDIASAADARAALAASGAAGVMVGRGAQGRPWIVGQIRAALAGLPVPPAPQGAALVDLVAGHHEAMLRFYGLTLGLRIARKHLGWYLDRTDPAPALRRRIVTSTDPQEVLHLLPEALAGAMA